MKNCAFSLFLLLSIFVHSHEKPQTVTTQFNYPDGKTSGQNITTEFYYSDNKPFGCNLTCSLSFLQENFYLRDLRDGFYQEEMLEATKTWILANRNEFLEVRHSERLLPAFIKYIEILPENKTEESSPEEKFSLENVNVGISFLFPTPENFSQLDITWLLSTPPQPGYKPEEQKNKAKDFKISVTDTGDEADQIALNSNNKSFTWFNKHHTPVMEIPKKEIQTFEKRSQLTISMIMLGISLLGIFICWIVVDNPNNRYMAMIYVFILINSVSFLKELKGIEERQVYILPEQDSLEKMMTRLLTNIYRGPISETPGWMFEELSKASTSTFRDKTFTQIYKSRAENSKTLQIIEDLKLESCKVIGDRHVECQWVINAHILHLHHIHEKNLRFKAVFKLTPEKDQWMIEEGDVIPVLSKEKT